jgi:hypothetical protein
VSSSSPSPPSRSTAKDDDDDDDDDEKASRCQHLSEDVDPLHVSLKQRYTSGLNSYAERSLQ